MARDRAAIARARRRLTVWALIAAVLVVGASVAWFALTYEPR